MTKIYSCLFTLVLPFLGFQSNAQFSFTDQTEDLLEETDFTSGIALAVGDINNDGRDDIVRLDSARVLQVEFQKLNGGKFVSLEYGQISNGGQWALVLGDVNNDGYNDIMTGGAYDNLKLFTYNPATFQFIQTVLPNSEIFLQGANFADINNDGFLDAFGCHDDAESHIWLNDGAGNMLSANETIDMATNPISDNSGNYGSVWSDFDNDRDLDLYIAKCRLGVNNPADPRRINALFENDGTHNYFNNSEKRNLKIGYQSWTADFGDIDNDGDFDCFLTNHDHECQILENDGRGNFTDITGQTGLNLFGYVYQGILRDLDNDGFTDILATNPTRFYRNNGDKTFTFVPNAVSDADPNSLAVGDLNHDGFLDIYTSFTQNINQITDEPDILFINDGNDNNFLAVDLEGTQSNKKGVGARIEIHGSWGIQIREVRAGESYGICNTLTQHFGLGPETVIDYLVVKWPSGITDVIQNPEPNQFLTVVENSSCQLPDFNLNLNGNSILCSGDSVQISAPDGYSYLWQNGYTGQTLTTHSGGNFQAIIIDDNGCVAASNVQFIDFEPNQTPTISVDGSLSLCEGETAVLTCSQALDYLWNTGEGSQSISISQSGFYLVTVTGNCQEWASDTVVAEVFAVASNPIGQNDTIFAPGTAVLTVEGDNILWFEDDVSLNPIAFGNSFETPHLDMTTVFWAEDIAEYGGGDFTAGEIQHSGSDFSSPNFNGELIFNVQRSLLLKTVTVYTDTYGEREIQIRDNTGFPVFSQIFDIQSDTTVLNMDFKIPEGNGYSITTNLDFNIQNLGMNSPQLKRSDENVNYPYEIEDIINIVGSSFGNGFYYYFYDWQIDADPLVVCPSERIPVTAVLEISGTSAHEDLSYFNVFPNPTSDIINIELEASETGIYRLRLTDLNGKILIKNQLSLTQNQSVISEMNLSEYAKGVYFLNIEKDGKSGWAKILVE